MRATTNITAKEFFITRNWRTKRASIDQILQEYDYVMLKVSGYSIRYKKPQCKYVVVSRQKEYLNFRSNNKNELVEFYKRTGEYETMKGARLAAKTNVFVKYYQIWIPETIVKVEELNYEPEVLEIMDYWVQKKEYTPWRIQAPYALHLSHENHRSIVKHAEA